MIKKVLISLLIVMVIAIIYLMLNPDNLTLFLTKFSFYICGYKERDLSEVVKEEELTSCDPYSFDEIVGLAGKDLRKKDFSQLSKEFLVNITFDTNTKWPGSDKLPKNFDPISILENCKDPGLEIRSIHEKGITGKGVSVAVFDKPIYQYHQEFKGRIHYIQVAPDDEKSKYHFHGIECASILTGNSIGVAPEAELYYFACPDKGKNSYYYNLAVDKLIEVNKSLPNEKKIRAVSISDSFDIKYKKAIAKAKNAGIYIVDSKLLGNSGFRFGGVIPFKDRNNPENYVYDKCFVNDDLIDEDTLLVPGNYRTVASTLGKNCYTYSANGGFSSVIPYVVGLAVLAWQVDSELTIEEIIDLLHTTKTNLENKNIVNPTRFIENVINNL